MGHSNQVLSWGRTTVTRMGVLISHIYNLLNSFPSAGNHLCDMRRARSRNAKLQQLLGPLFGYPRCRIIMRTQNGAIILTTIPKPCALPGMGQLCYKAAVFLALGVRVSRPDREHEQLQANHLDFGL